MQGLLLLSTPTPTPILKPTSSIETNEEVDRARLGGATTLCESSTGGEMARIRKRKARKAKIGIVRVVSMATVYSSSSSGGGGGSRGETNEPQPQTATLA